MRSSTNNEIIVKVRDKPKITDHAWLKIEMKSVIKSNENYKIINGRDYSKFNMSEFLKSLEVNIVQGQGLSVNARAERLIGKIVDTLNTAAPKKIFKIPNIWYGKKWFSSEIRMSATERDKAYRKAVSTDTEQDWLKYKVERNKVVKLIKIKKKEYNENMIDSNKNDPTTMWKTLKEVIRGEPMEHKITENIDFELDNVNECNIEGKCNIADKFNLFYIESINNIVKSIEGDRKKSPNKTIYVVKMKDTIESFEMIEERYLEKIVMNLANKKGTEEGISSDVLKSIFHVIKDEFLGVINDSLRTGQCPEGWKTSTIIPIPKVNKPKKASEYRPINILPIYEKVLELVVKEQIERYLDRNDIITANQSGFRKRHSCETAIQMIMDEWKLLISEGKMIGVIFMDLKQAFETVNRERLLGKLEQYGIKGTVLKWFQSYLSNRRQQACCGDIISGLMENYNGVPQGSVWGPCCLLYA